MNDPPHVRFVDAHSEGYGGTDYLYPVVDEVVLRQLACSRTESGMVYGGFYSLVLQYLCHFLRIVPAHAVNDSAFVFMTPDEFDDGTYLFFLLIASLDGEAQVRAVER